VPLGRLPGLLGRLRVRQKLVLLVLPLLALVVIGAVPLVADRIGAAEKSSRTAHVVQRAVRIGDLVQELQQERLASVGYLSGGVGRDRLVARSARAVDQAAQLATDYRDEDDDRLASALRTVTQSSGLGGLRGRVLRGGVTGLTVYMGYTRAIDGLLDARTRTSPPRSVVRSWRSTRSSGMTRGPPPPARRCSSTPT
jgi:Nitrate and nitrite sensing